MMRPEDFVALSLAEAPTNDAGGFGYSMRLASGNPNPPGCLALTWIAGRDASERDRIRAHAKQNVADFLQEPGFISIVTGFIGLRGFTVTAWETEEAMKELFADNFVGSVWTSVWKPGRLNRMWVRCPTCNSLENVDDDPSECSACGAPLPERPAFW